MVLVHIVGQETVCGGTIDARPHSRQGFEGGAFDRKLWQPNQVVTLPHMAGSKMAGLPATVLTMQPLNIAVAQGRICVGRRHAAPCMVRPR